MNADAPSTPRQRLLAHLYEAFNRQDFDEVCSHLSLDVAWPNMIEMTVLHGPAQVRAYWQDQLTQFIPTVSPLRYIERGDEVVVLVEQQVSTGGQVARSTLAQRYEFVGDLITAMAVEAVDGYDAPGR